jgi:chemotaxis protein MotB
MVDTTEGTRIDLVDDADFSMFALGTTVLTLRMRAPCSGRSPRPSRPKPGWSPSAATPIRCRGRAGCRPTTGRSRPAAPRRRASSCMRDGIGERRFRRIEGVADRELLIADHPEDPRNRRMSILLTR